MQIDGDNNIQVNGNLKLNISGELPVSKKTLKKLIRKEIESVLLKKTKNDLVRSYTEKKHKGLCSSHEVAVKKINKETLLQCLFTLKELLKKPTELDRTLQKRAHVLFELLSSEIKKTLFSKMHVAYGFTE